MKFIKQTKKVSISINHIKWLAAAIILVAMFFHTLGLVPWNSFLQLLGTALWVFAGYKTNDKAIMFNFGAQWLVIIPSLIYLLIS